MNAVVINPYVYPGVVRTKKTSSEIVEFIEQVVCTQFQVSRDLIYTKTRKREVVVARMAFMYLLKKHTSFSLKKIGITLRRDHTTVIHAIKTIDDLMSVYPDIKRSIQILHNSIKNNLTWHQPTQN